MPGMEVACVQDVILGVKFHCDVKTDRAGSSRLEVIGDVWK